MRKDILRTLSTGSKNFQVQGGVKQKHVQNYLQLTFSETIFGKENA